MTLIIQIRMKVTEKLIWNKSNISLRSRHALKGQPIKHTAQDMPHSVQKFYQCSSKLERTNSATWSSQCSNEPAAHRFFAGRSSLAHRLANWWLWSSCHCRHQDNIQIWMINVIQFWMLLTTVTFIQIWMINVIRFWMYKIGWSISSNFGCLFCHSVPL